MNLYTRFAALLFCLSLGLLGCASTGLAESWIDPSIKALPRFQKVFVAYLGVDSAAQRIAEDALASHLPRAEVLKCYQRYPDARQLDAAQLKADLRAAGCDGALVLRLARVSQQVSYTPSTYPAHYRSLSGYWGWAEYENGDMRTDEIVHVETNVYSLAEDKLIYTARSESFNPGSSADLMDEIATAIAKDLKKKGLAP